MNILLWVLQGVLALHTVAGAIWKFKKTAAETMPSLGAIPQPIWMGMGVVEILCAVALVLPALGSSFDRLPAIGATIIAADMLVLCATHIASGNASNVGPMIYWLVVATLCGFVAYARSPLLAS